eukprot:m.99259 g.99259  ORF g.99259 m.99259 type:complete len:133 (-) comp15095_c0_seq4:511-909(-)
MKFVVLSLALVGCANAFKNLTLGEESLTGKAFPTTIRITSASEGYQLIPSLDGDVSLQRAAGAKFACSRCHELVPCEGNNCMKAVTCSDDIDTRCLSIKRCKAKSNEKKINRKVCICFLEAKLSSHTLSIAG